MPMNTSHIFVNSASLMATNIQEDESDICYSRLLTIIFKTQPMFLLVFGFIANLCSFAVLTRPRLRRRPTFSYLAFLSLSNSLLSLVHASFTILGVYFGLTLDNLPLFIFCRFLNRFVIDFLTHFSLYTLTAVDLDRIRTVTSKTTGAHRASRSNVARQHGWARAFVRVCFVDFFVGFILFLFNLHLLFSYGHTIPHPDGIHYQTTCAPELNNLTEASSYTIGYNKYLTSILPVIEMILFNILPFLISVIATIVILKHVSTKYTLLNHINKRLKKSRRRMELHLSILLISLNCVFILFTTPHNIVTIYMGQIQKHLGDDHDENQDDVCPIYWLQKSLDLLQQCYFMSTFFLYILTNKRFREEFYELIKRNFFSSCRHARTTRSTTQISSRHRRHHSHSNGVFDKINHLQPPKVGMMQTRYSISEYMSHDDYEDEDAPSTSRGCETSDARINTNHLSLI